jgi:hypothetical protein
MACRDKSPAVGALSPTIKNIYFEKPFCVMMCIPLVHVQMWVV